MKSILRTFVITLATMVASSAYAQMPQGGQRPERPQFSPENMAKMQTEQMAQTMGVTEQLKAQDQMAWVQQMNNIRHSAAEIVNEQVIYS